MKRVAAKIVPKLFTKKATSHGQRSGDANDVQRRFRFAQKGHNWERIMGVWLDIDTKAQSSQWKYPEVPRLKKHVKAGQM